MATLHKESVQRFLGLTRLHILFHLVAVLFLFYYRITQLLSKPTVACLLMTIAELLFTETWFFSQAFRWRRLSREVMPENLPRDQKLPGLDIFVCTLDPKKEPTVEVMDTVVSAMAMDYPADKLAVYLSDDGGCPVTLYAMKEASEFAKEWLPFCTKYRVKSRCPKVFFSPMGEDEHLHHDDGFRTEKEQLKEKYNKMQKNIEKFGSDPKNCSIVFDRPSRIEIINDQPEMPLVVYVSRERRPTVSHRYKGGALNTLLRVSGLFSNGPYVLVVDCDMYCNDASSAKQAMCFFLDPETSKDVAFVQFPQMFHNLSKKDIYDSQTRHAFTTMWQGMDGLRGPGLAGSGNYLRRSALLFESPNQNDSYERNAQNKFGKSTMYIESLKAIHGQQTAKKNIPRNVILQEARAVASCSYEIDTNWGSEVGFSYAILIESSVTGYLLHCRGWRSTYLYPKRPCFLGCAPTDLKEGMLQLVKWSSEFCLLGLSKYSPFTYGISRLPIMHAFTFCYLTSTTHYAIPLIVYGIIPQVCFFKGIPVFPMVTEPWFIVFAILYVSFQSQHLVEVLYDGCSLPMWWDEQRIWIIRSLIVSIFAPIAAMKKIFGLNKAKFTLSNKAIDKENLKKYEKGKFNFEGAAVFMTPLAVLLIVNIVCFFGGLWRLHNVKDFEKMFGQLFLLGYLVALSYPIFEGIITMKSKGG
ncbi:cellulose synthase-like protein G1 [Cajanus cajan]|uniref:Cellulose synthase-like protein G1 n=1 Tax=Cajanus cajan TaxID=3821 RepID=A0A151QV05_CAJCA|nr:cellulose synthase-like protein G1 [Cajanus cajan]KYP34106.1 Cellulose synthase-like protein G1 [Cajanus cajan]